jgi:hypothetical protein
MKKSKKITDFGLSEKAMKSVKGGSKGNGNMSNPYFSENTLSGEMVK